MESEASYVGPPISGLNLNWKILALEDVCENIFDCPHSTPKLANDGYFMVRTQDIRQGFFDITHAVKVSEETYRERTKRATPSFGDILLSREGTYFGDAAEIPSGTSLCLGQRMVLLRLDPRKIRTSFLRMWINSLGFQNYLAAFRDGTVAERLNVSTIRRLPVPVPDLGEQDAIVSQYIPLEEKQHLNRRMNQTLEAMAQAIFKSWFVDFDPVKAKAATSAAGKSPEAIERAAMAAIAGKSESELDLIPEPQRQSLAKTAVLFPTTFQGSELGEIPEGWEPSALVENVRITNHRSITEIGVLQRRRGRTAVPSGCYKLWR